MKYRELLEISKKYPNCCKGSCSDRKDGKCKANNIEKRIREYCDNAQKSTAKNNS